MELKRINGEVIAVGATVIEIAVANKKNLRGANLSGANLRGADLSGANLCGADLREAYLSGADLSGAYLCGADLSGANLTDITLCCATLDGALVRDGDIGGPGHILCALTDAEWEGVKAGRE